MFSLSAMASKQFHAAVHLLVPLSHLKPDLPFYSSVSLQVEHSIMNYSVILEFDCFTIWIIVRGFGLKLVSPHDSLPLLLSFFYASGGFTLGFPLYSLAMNYIAQFSLRLCIMEQCLHLAVWYDWICRLL